MGNIEWVFVSCEVDLQEPKYCKTWTTLADKQPNKSVNSRDVQFSLPNDNNKILKF